MYYSLDDLLNLHESGIAVYNKGLILRAYESRYKAIRSNIIWAVCTNKDNYIVHMRIPSEDEHCKNVFYDVVFELSPTRKLDTESGTLKNYNMRLYCNAPSFTFTFTYAYNKYNLIIPWLKGRCIRRCLTDPATTRNPHNIIGTDSKIWFAAYHFKTLGLDIKQRFRSAITTSASYIHKIVHSQEYVLRNRAAMERQARLAERQEKEKERSKRAYAERTAENGIKSLVDAYATKNGSNINTKAVTKRIVKAAKSPRMARAARHARSAK